jgi:cell division topological specificity factor
MNLFRSLQLAASAPVARERLQILLEYERKLGSQIDLFTALREEILAVVSRHVVDPEKVQVTVDRGAKFSTLGVNIEIPNTAGKARMLSTMRGVDAVAGTVAGGGRPPALFVGALLLAKKAGSVPLITSLFRVGLIAVMVLGAWLYVQQRDVSKRRALNDRGTALMAGFEEQVNAPLPAEGVVAAAGTSVVSPGTSSPGTVAQSTAVTSPAAPASTTSPQKPLPLRGSVIDPSQKLPPPRDPTAAEPAPQSAAVIPRAALESATSPPKEPPPLRDSAAAEPASQSTAVIPRAALESATSPPQEPPPLRDSVATEPASQSTAVTAPAAPASITLSPHEPLPLWGSVIAPSQEPPSLRDRAAPEPVLQSAFTPPAAPASTTSPQEPLPLRGSVIPPSQEPPPLRDRAAAEPAMQSAAVTLLASPGNITRLPARRFVTCNVRRTSIRSKWPWPSSKLSYARLPCERFRVYGGGSAP